MESRLLGSSGLTASPIGLGTAGLGAPRMMELEAQRVIHAAVDLGVRFIDTARASHHAEERLGRHLGARRNRVVLATKGGHGVDGVPDWSPEAITLGIHRALRTLRTDRIDLFQLHGCPAEVLADDEVLEALMAAKEAGKILAAGFCGEGDALEAALERSELGAVTCTVNLYDQENLARVALAAQRAGLGLIAKRGLASAVSVFDHEPTEGAEAIYWLRRERMPLPEPEFSALDQAVRFVCFAPGVDVALVGCRSVGHLEEVLASADNGPLPEEEEAAIRAAFVPHAGLFMPIV